jgi:hypothetical protein
MWEMNLAVHRIYAGDVGDERLARRMQATDLRRIGRARLGLGQVDAARAAYRESVALDRHPAGLAWAALVTLPGASAPLKALAARRRAREARAA